MTTIQIIRQYFSPWRILLGATEALVFVVALYIGVKVGLDVSWVELKDFFVTLAPEAIFFATIMLLSLAGTGLYQWRLNEGRSGMIVRLFIGIVLGILLVNQFSYMIPDLDLGQKVWLAVVGLAMVGVLFSRLILFRMLSSLILQRRVIILGTGEKAKSLVSEQSQYGFGGYKIIGFIPLDEEDKHISSALIIESKDDILALARKYTADEIVVAVEPSKALKQSESLIQCEFNGIRVTDVTTFIEREAGKLCTDWLPHDVLLNSYSSRSFSRIIKRGIDILVSLSLMVLLTPIFSIMALLLLVKHHHWNKIITTQSCVGQGGKCFTCYRFGSLNKAFPYRHILHNLPKLYNVLKGDMSLVGPTPHTPEIAWQHKQCFTYYPQRQLLKPGLTGWSKVQKFYGSRHVDKLNRLQYDLYYVKNNSLFLDFVVLLQTAEMILWPKG